MKDKIKNIIIHSYNKALQERKEFYGCADNMEEQDENDSKRV